MAFDSFALDAIVQELQPRLIGGKINRIHQPDPHTVLLRFHSQNGQGKLILSAHPEQGRISLTESSPENPTKAPMFLMVLRKWVENARIRGLKCTEGERVACLTLEARDELGDTRELKLIIEIMGKHSNIILINEENVIIDGIRRYNSSLSRYREVLPGRPYLPPPPMKKQPIPPSDENALGAILWETPGNTVETQLKTKLKGISPLLAAHLLEKAGLSKTDLAETLGLREISLLQQELLRLHQMKENNAYTPYIRVRNGAILDFAPFQPACWPEEESQSVSSMNEGVDCFYQAKESAQRFHIRQNALGKVLRHHISRMEKKINLEEKDLYQCEAADTYKTAGDLLAANLWYLEKGTAQVHLPSFEDAEVLITVDMDPAKTPQENVQQYYRRYAKAKKARSSIERQLTINREELYQLQGMEQALYDAESTEELMALEREATAGGYLRPINQGKGKNQEKRPAPLSPRKVLSKEGFIILIGRNNKQNDKLSLGLADAQDIWLHAQKIPGSHVIIQTKGQEIPDSVLEEAAAYAAWYSKAREAGNVAVDWVQAGKLKKPAGARPGFVTYTGQKTIVVQAREPEKLS